MFYITIIGIFMVSWYDACGMIGMIRLRFQSFEEIHKKRNVAWYRYLSFTINLHLKIMDSVYDGCAPAYSWKWVKLRIVFFVPSLLIFFIGIVGKCHPFSVMVTKELTNSFLAECKFGMAPLSDICHCLNSKYDINWIW